MEALLLSLHLNEMLQLWVHCAQTRRRRRRRIHPSATARAEMNPAPTHRPSRVSTTEPEPQPAASRTAPRAHCGGARLAPQPAALLPGVRRRRPALRAVGLAPGHTGTHTHTPRQCLACAFSAEKLPEHECRKKRIKGKRKSLKTTWPVADPPNSSAPARFQIGPRFPSSGVAHSRGCWAGRLFSHLGSLALVL